MRKDRMRPQRSMRECGTCGKYPLFFYEEEPYKWILAEWNDEHRPIRHSCKMKRKFNEF